MGNLDAFTLAGKHHRMIPNNITTAERRKADGAVLTRTCVPVA